MLIVGIALGLALLTLVVWSLAKAYERQAREEHY